MQKRGEEGEREREMGNIAARDQEDRRSECSVCGTSETKA